jgi:hypothetical protein
LSGRIDFSEEEWQLLSMLPSRIGISVMIASSTRFFGAGKEINAMRDAIADNQNNFAGNQLVGEMIPYAESERKRQGWKRNLRKRRESYHSETVELCEMGSSILSSKPDREESEVFKRWLLFIGEEVANAFLTDEFMGIGGVVISKDEEKVLKKIASALGMKGYSVRARDDRP